MTAVQGTYDVFTNYWTSKVKDAAKIMQYSHDWGVEFGLVNAQSAGAIKFRNAANITKLVAGGAFEIPKNVKKMGEKVVELVNPKNEDTAIWERIKGVFWSVVDSVSSFVDTLELGIVNIASETFRIAKGLAGVSLILGMGRDMIAAFDKIASADLNADRALALDTISANLIKLAKSVSFFVLGCLIALSIFFNVVAPGVAFLSAATSALVFSILGYFNDEVGEPTLARRDLTK